MIEVVGRKNKAIIYTNNVEPEAILQIIELCNQDFVSGSQIRVMPDCHAGAGCTIGFTMTITDKICPNLVGVDIGCGMLTICLGDVDLDYKKIDDFIRNNIPYGRNVYSGREQPFEQIYNLKCFRELRDSRRLERSLGTLGGGNHFIEVDVDDEGCKFLVIHTGSRNLGYQVANLYQKLAVEICSGKDQMYKERNEIIETYKNEGRKKEIQSALKMLYEKYRHLHPDIPEDLCYLTGEYLEDYLHDMKICQEFAIKNRRCIADKLIDFIGENPKYMFETVHNYINFDDNILRKGAISAKNGELLLIPVNMRDGCIIGVGKGNPEWNYSAPHGAGRIMSRNKAREVLDLEEFKQSMSGIYTTSISMDTIDEAPMAYKSMDEIIRNIRDSVEITKIIKPVYNFKAAE